ncbi:MAG: hypothetical protein K6F60_03080 [Eubacterium sp.]|nr:hypothetical protein [Eubacterium sp.]
MRIEAKGTRYRLYWTVTVDYIEGHIDILFNGQKNEMEEVAQRVFVKATILSNCALEGG